MVVKDQLEKFLKSGTAWEKMETDVPGIFIVKAPGPKANPDAGRLMLEVNPVDESGKPRKFKGLMLNDREGFTQFLETMQDDRIYKVLTAMEEVNPPKAQKAMKKLKLD